MTLILRLHQALLFNTKKSRKACKKWLQFGGIFASYGREALRLAEVWTVFRKTFIIRALIFMVQQFKNRPFPVLGH